MARLFLIISVFFVLLPTPVLADLVTIEASGTINWVASGQGLDPLLGKVLSISMVYSTQATDIDPDTENARYLDTIQSFSSTINGQYLSSLPLGSSPPPQIQVNNDAVPFWDPTLVIDNFTAIASGVGLNVLFTDPDPDLGPYTSAISYLVLRDLDHNAFTDTLLPTSFDLSKMESKFLSVILDPTPFDISKRIDATITSFDVGVVSVPEPSLMILLSISVLSLAGLKRWLKE